MGLRIHSDHTKEVLTALDIGVQHILEGLAKYHAEAFREEVTENSVDESGERSQPGEFPFRDEGNLADNIAYKYDNSTRSSAFGVLVTTDVDSEGLEPYEYILKLENEMGRLGLAASFLRNSRGAESYIRRTAPFR